MKKNKGITLVTLVITIIVLFILAGIAISAISGENGILTNAQKAASQTKAQSLEEELKVKYAKHQVNSNNTELKGTSLYGRGTNDKGEFQLIEYNGNNFRVYYEDDGETVKDVEYFELKELNIYNCDEMIAFGQRVNNGENFGDYIVRLKNDLDFEGAAWNTIGYSALRANEEYGDAYFAGLFDGENHVIKNLVITDTRYEAGIFGNNQGTIKNLNVEDLSINKSTTYILYVAGIAATNSGTIENCSAKVQILATSTSSMYSAYVGAIVGSNSGTIINSISKGQVEIGGYNVDVGGIAGGNFERIEKCVNESTVIINEQEYVWGANVGTAGGMTGENRGTVYQCKNVGEVRGYSYYIGGIVGENLFSAVIEECVNSGNLSTSYEKNVNQSYAPYLAGICGYNWEAIVKNSYNIGNIIVDSSSYSAYELGGIVGKDVDSTVINCYSAGEISGGMSRNAIGGTTLESNCYYDSDVSVATDSNATPITTSVFKSDEMINKLGDAYKKNPNGGYPLLNWE